MSCERTSEPPIGMMTSRVPGIWALGPSVYLPSLLFATGQGAVLPVLAVSALNLGASVSEAGAMVGLLGLGKMAAAIPAGSLAALRGERIVMLSAAALIALASVLCSIANTIVVLGAGVLALGCGSALWGLARHTFLAENMPHEVRARAFSVLGGVQRTGAVAGPFVGAAAIHFVDIDGAYWAYGAVAVLAGGLIGAYSSHDHIGMTDRQNPSMSTVIRNNGHLLRTLGFAALLVSASRMARQAIVPLWAEHIGLEPAVTSVVFGIGTAVDLVCFYPGGVLMDRFGRAEVGTPALTMIGAAYMLVPLTRNATELIAVAALCGVGNGLTSGLVSVLGADASPAAGRPKFLSVWRMTSDLGEGLGPGMLAGLAALTTLTPSVIGVGAVCWLAASTLRRWLPRHSR